MELPEKEKIKQVLTSKSLIGAFIFAIALWGYTQLNGSFVTLVEVPFEVNLPKNRAVENELPGSVSVEARGTGWNLFTLIFFNSSAQCYVDLSKSQVTDSVHILSRTDLMKSVDYFVNVEPIDVLPEQIPLKIGNISTIRIPVIPDIEILPRSGFAHVGEIKVIPDSIEISGNEKILRRIKSWKTSPIKFEDTQKPFTAQVNLKDTLGTIIELSEKKVEVSIDIQQLAEIIFPDVKIRIRGGSASKKHKIQPEYLVVTLQGGIGQLTDLSPEEISASIGYNQMLNDTTGIIRPKIQIPEGIRLLRTDPPYIYHTKMVDKPRISGLL